MIASPSNFPIGLFLAYVSRVGLKKGFEKGVFSSMFIMRGTVVIAVKRISNPTAKLLT